MSFGEHEIHSFSTRQLAFDFASNCLSGVIEQSISNRGHANIIVSSGVGVAGTLKTLVNLDLDWSKTNFVIADEHWNEIGSETSNLQQVRKILHEFPPSRQCRSIGPEQTHSITKSAQDFTSRIGDIDIFDACLLGMGDDGHIASLFPNHAALDSNETCFPILDSPKAPAQRITIGMKVLQGCAHRLIVTVGSSKAYAIRMLRSDNATPVRRLVPTSFICDQEAWG